MMVGGGGRRREIIWNYVEDGEWEGNKEGKYAASVTKTKAATDDLKYIKDMILKLWSIVKRLMTRMFHWESITEDPNILSVIRLTIENQFRLFLLYVQPKIHNLAGDEIVHLVNALRMFTKSIIIQRRAEDVKIAVERYQEKLNITRPNISGNGISSKEPYTIFYELRGVVYLNKSKRKRLMTTDELYKFSDCTLKIFCDILHDMLNNFVLGYNHVLPKRA
nr:hypothetical protein [Tanacetum cinerariifolium]